eukprot:4383557-Alexandrium_andersonii.AAC.1
MLVGLPPTLIDRLDAQLAGISEAELVLGQSHRGEHRSRPRSAARSQREVDPGCPGAPEDVKRKARSQPATRRDGARGASSAAAAAEECIKTWWPPADLLSLIHI